MGDGFFDTYVDDNPGGGTWISGDEKEKLVESGDPFDITAVSLDPGDKYGERFVLDVVLNTEARKIGFQTGTVDSRDRMLSSMAEFLEENAGSQVRAKLTASGRSTLVTAA
jgi:hypothetical protein